MSQQVLLGKIITAHGIKGQVKILSFTQNPRDIGKYQPLLDKNGKEFNLTITGKSSGASEQNLIASISHVKTRDQAELLRGTELFFDKNKLPKAKKDEFYYIDLIGLDVINEENIKIGKIIDVNNFGAGDIFEIEFNENSGQKEKLQMFSFRSDIFTQINLTDRFVKMISPEIIELNLSKSD